MTWRPAAAEIDAPAAGEMALALSCPEAVGGVDFTARRGPKEQQGLLHSILLPEPEAVLAQLTEKLRPLLDAEDVTGVVEMVRERGWKAAHAVYQEWMRQAKREWSGISGRTYGSNVAADWRPDGWRAEWDRRTVQEADAQVVEARDALAALMRVDAISEAAAEASEEARGRTPVLESNLKSATIAADAARANVDAARADVETLRKQSDRRRTAIIRTQTHRRTRRHGRHRGRTPAAHRRTLGPR